MLGVILCGGNSSRMGTDKGLLTVQKTSWAGSAIKKMSALDIPVVLSVNSGQQMTYRANFAEEILIADDPGLPVKGPLAGILSIHIQYPTHDLFVLACDMPYIETSLLEDLYEYAGQDGAREVYLYSNDGEPEPLCGIYTAGALNVLLRMLQSGQLLKHSMKYSLEQLKVCSRPIPENKKRAFSNINTSSEMPGGHPEDRSG